MHDAESLRGQQPHRPRARVLFLADTHLGIDLPERPRVERRRRGDDFFSNYDRALAPAMRGEVDLVVHGGDLFFRSRVRADIVERAFAPLAAIADRGIPVYIVPGNHERSQIPFPLLGAHRNIHVFRSPRTFTHRFPGLTVSLSGFPFVRGDIRATFPDVLRRTGWQDAPADVRVLCMHHAVEGARVGPADFTFRSGADTIRTADLPEGFAAILSGHIHRAQRLSCDLSGQTMAVPVLYPGSIERTSFAERDERKGFLLLDLVASAPGLGGCVENARFRPLPARPMRDASVDVDGLALDAVARRIGATLGAFEPDAIVRLNLTGRAGSTTQPQITAEFVRSIAPRSMNVELGLPVSAL